MKNIIINMYINKLTKEDIISFAKKEKVTLTEEETNIIYNAIKKDKDIILSKEFFNYITKYKEVFSKEVYNKILELAHKYEKFIS